MTLLHAARLALLSFALAQISACFAPGHVPASPPVGSYEVTRIGNTETPGAGIELEFTDDGRVTGSTGVNRCSGRIEVEGGSLSFTPMITTRMAGPAPAMELERRFLDALPRITGWRQADGDLVLLDGGSVKMRLAPR